MKKSSFPILKNKELMDINRSVSDLENRKKELIDNIISGCSHPIKHVQELPYTPETSDSHCAPPWLICTLCGLAEEGRSYKKLGHTGDKKLKTISDEDFYCVATKLVSRTQPHLPPTLDFNVPTFIL